MFRRIKALFKGRKGVRTALSTLSYLYDDGSDALDALGGLTQEELSAVCSLAKEAEGGLIVEVGTLFGFTALAMKKAAPNARVVAVDNFCWNPFGLPPDRHEQFTRTILEGSGVELIRASSSEWRQSLKEVPAMVFFDADHRYETVKEELEWAKQAGIKIISGHDYANPNPRFGVTRAVDEAFPGGVKTAGMVFFTKMSEA